MFEHYKISDMIKALEKQKEEHGDLDLLLASDPAGDNLSYVGDLVQYHGKDDEQRQIEQNPFKVHEEKLIIFPSDPRPIYDFFKDIT